MQKQEMHPLKIRTMFDEIARKYDFLNHFLSFGLDIIWRKYAIKLIEEKRGGVILDIATGSGDFTLSALKLQPSHIIASDFSFQMLSICRSKILKNQKYTKIDIVSCDALKLPFKNESFDATLIAFGIRNFIDRTQSLREMYRVLKPNGISVIIELTPPKNSLISIPYHLYSKIILPFIGKLISTHATAYRYLPTSISQFPTNEEFSRLMQSVGFSKIKIVPLTFGITTIFLGRK